MKKTITYALAALLVSTSLHAGGGKNIAPSDASVVAVPTLPTASKFYLGLGLGVDRVNSFLYGTDTAYSAVLKAGYDFNQYVGIEARGTYGISDGDQLGHDYSYGLYLKPQYPINEKVNLYGLLGYAQTKISFDNQVAFNGNTNNYTTQSDFSFGAGVDYKINSDWSVYADAVRYIDKETTRPEGKYAAKVDSFSLGVAYHF
jgi:OOP family OmpA-OmpF porin